jgi:hypothetical protein
VARQPENQLVEEKNDRVVAEALRMAADGGQDDIERHVRFLLAADDVAVGGEEGLDQLADQACAQLVSGRGPARLLEGCDIPPGGHRAPAAAGNSGAGIELTEERLVSDLTAESLGVCEQGLGLVDTRQRRFWMQPAHVLMAVIIQTL